MGAKKKPQETRVARRPRRRRDRQPARPARGPRCYALGDPPPRGETQQDRGRRLSAREKIVEFLAEKRLSVSTLVFLEHHGGELQKDSLGVLCEGGVSSAATSPASVVGSGVEGPAAQAGNVRRRRRSTSPTTPALERAAAAAARRRGSRSSCGDGASTPFSSAQSVLAADVAAGLAARLDAGLNWDLVGPRRQDGEARRQAAGAAATPSTSTSAGQREPRLALFRTGRLRRRSRARRRGARSRTSAVELRGLLHRRRRWSSRRTRRARGPSIEDADVIVAGGRGLGGPENFALVEELAQALGGAVAATARRRRRGLVPVLRRRSARPARPSRRSSTSPSASPARSSTRSACRARDVIVAINKDAERADLRVRRPRRRRRPARDRPEADRARPAQAQERRDRRATFRRRSALREVDRPADRSRRTSGSRSASLIVGAGPAGLACAIRLGQLLEECAGRCRAARRGAGRGDREGQAAGLAPALRRGRQPARAAAGSSPDASGWTKCRSTGRSNSESVYFLTQQQRGSDPDAADDEEPRQLRRLALPSSAAGSPSRRRRRGAIDPAGDRRRRGCSSTTAACAASAPATRGAAATARSSPNFEPGSDVVARVTVLAEGTQGHLTGAAIERFGLEGENPQVWALGVKEVWTRREATAQA